MSQGDVIRLELPATHQYLNILEPFAVALLSRVEQLPEPVQAAYNIHLAIHEICTNIVDHAYKGHNIGRIALELRLTKSPAGLTVTLTDSGRPFEAALVKVPSLEEPQVRGYGLFLTGQLADEIVYERRGDHNYWRLRFEFSGG